MKRIWTVLTLLALVLVGVVAARKYAERYAVLTERARVAEARADSVAEDARKRDAEARTAREAILAATEARKAAERQMRATQAALHTLLDSVEASAADTSVGRDSLARLVTALAIKIRADSVARAEADSLADVERLKAGLALAEQVLATDRWRDAYEAKVEELAAVKRVGRRGFLAQLASVACTVALTGASAEVGSKVYPEGGAAIGGAGGYLTSRVICK